MTMDFMAAMRRATEATRALDVAGATRLIREALDAGARPDTAAPPPPSAAVGRPPTSKTPKSSTTPHRALRHGRGARSARSFAGCARGGLRCRG